MSATLPTTDGPDYVIELNGEAMDRHDGGGDDRGGYVEGIGEVDGETVIVIASYDRAGIRVSANRDPYGEDAIEKVGEMGTQPGKGTGWVIAAGELEGTEIAVVPQESDNGE